MPDQGHYLRSSSNLIKFGIHVAEGQAEGTETFIPYGSVRYCHSLAASHYPSVVSTIRVQEIRRVTHPFKSMVRTYEYLFHYATHSDVSK
jgi:hypothetical protein